MGFHIHDDCSRCERGDLEEGRALTTAEGNRFLHARYPYLYGRGLHASWKLFGCCTLVGLVNAFVTSFTLAVTMTLGTSNIILQSNALLLSTGFLVSLFWCLHGSHFQSMKERCRADNELLRVELCIIACLFTVMLSPAVACLPLLTIFWMLGGEALSYETPGIPLILSWVMINTLAVFLIPSFVLGRDAYQRHNSIENYTPPQEDSEGYENFDETDGPTFLPQRPVSASYSIPQGFLHEEIKAAITFTSAVSWKNAIEPSETLHELVRWAVSVPEESLQPSIAVETLTTAATSIGVRVDGMDDWSQDVQYTYLVSRICDRLAEIFRQADPSAVPDHAADVFLFVNRLEQFDGVDIAVLGSDNGKIPAKELEGIARCLKSRSASLLGC